MSERVPSVLIQDWLDAIQNIEEYTSGMDFESFNRDKKTKDAVLRNLEVLGEAANCLAIQLKAQYSMVEWHKIIRSRHIVIHDYFIIDYEIIWRITSFHLPPLKTSLKEILAQL